MVSSRCKISPIIPTFVGFLLLYSSLSAVVVSSLITSQDDEPQFRTNQAGRELQKLKRIRAHLRKINKPSVKTIQSSDGDLIDCVPLHLQPAFDHPELKGQKPVDQPERPQGYREPDSVPNSFQLWTNSGESCPEGTIPIRRTKEEDILRVRSIRRFGRKGPIGRDLSLPTSSKHERAVGYAIGDDYFGAKVKTNVWAPHVANQYRFSLSQMWLMSGSIDDLDTIEAGWVVNYKLFGDNSPRFFTYWTNDSYQATGCFNLLCSGFVQTSNQIALGAAICPKSPFIDGGQLDISLFIWKDPKNGNWWLEFGSGLVVGYWPSFLFGHLRNHANMIQFGGEIVNNRPSSMFNMSTQMGRGHAGDGFRIVSYFWDLQYVTYDNTIIPLLHHQLLALRGDHSNCFDVQRWGNSFYYGGPGNECLTSGKGNI